MNRSLQVVVEREEILFLSATRHCRSSQISPDPITANTGVTSRGLQERRRCNIRASLARAILHLSTPLQQPQLAEAGVAGAADDEVVVDGDAQRPGSGWSKFPSSATQQARDRRCLDIDGSLWLMEQVCYRCRNWMSCRKALGWVVGQFTGGVAWRRQRRADASGSMDVAGRTQNDAEHRKSGRRAGGRTSVIRPPIPVSYTAAPPGSVYAKFNVPTSVLRQGR